MVSTGWQYTSDNYSAPTKPSEPIISHIITAAPLKSIDTARILHDRPFVKKYTLTYFVIALLSDLLASYSPEFKKKSQVCTW